MALSALKTFVAGEVLTASDLNAMNTHILTNPMILISPLTGNLAAGGNDIIDIDELQLSDAAANPTASGRLRRNGNALVWAVEDARTATVATALVLQSVATAAPADNIGAGLRLRAESSTDNPLQLAEIAGRLDSVTAGAETSSLAFTTLFGASGLTTHTTVTADGGLAFNISPAGSPPANSLHVRAIVDVWGTVSITPTLEDSFNITSVADAGVGLVTITFNTDFPDATNYAMVASGDQAAVAIGFDTFAAGSVRVMIRDLSDVAGDQRFRFIGIGAQ